MFISITFPLADFRGLHSSQAGRLARPAWGKADPQAQFARGFGSIHTRTKSGNGFVGENYYADCQNLVRYPQRFMLTPILERDDEVLAYPIYRRFYFDGDMAGRFELGFRLDEETIANIGLQGGTVAYGASKVAREVLEHGIRADLLDGRALHSPTHDAMLSLRDGWILSSTETRKLARYDIETVGSTYVGVGRPFVFIRTGAEIALAPEQQRRTLLDQDHLELFVTRSGVHGQHFDTAVIVSPHPLDKETARERLARLFYTQIRSLAFAHSFYLLQISQGKFSAPRSLEPALQALLDRLARLTPLDGQPDDEVTCAEMRKIVRNLDINTARLAQEIEEQLQTSGLKQSVSGFFRFLDRKADVAVEAAASAATTRLLSGGP